MNPELWGIVEELRKNKVPIEDKEAEDVCNLCLRKMEVAGVKEKDSYLPLLYKDEIKNYCIRRAVNATTVLRQLQKEGIDECVVFA